MVDQKDALLGAAPSQHQSVGNRVVKNTRRSKVLAGLTLSTVGVLYLYSSASQTVQSRSAIANLAATSPGVCTAAACVHASSEILYNLSPQYKKLDPCTNFEELVCGGWRDRHDLRPDQGDAFTGTTMAETSQTVLRHILEADYPHESMHSHFSPQNLEGSKLVPDERNFDKMQSAYNACLNENAIKKQGLSPLIEIIEHLREIIPGLDRTLVGPKHITEAITFLAKLGVSALVTPFTGADDMDPDTVVISISPPGRIGLPSKERYEDEELVGKYKMVVSSVLSYVLPGTDKGIHGSVVEFERRLAAISPSQEDRENPTKSYNPLSYDDAAGLVSSIHLKALVEALAPHDYRPTKVIVTSPDYLEQLSEVIDSTNANVILAYLSWKVVQSFASFVEAPALDEYRRFTNTLQGKDADAKPERWRKCVNHVDDSLGWILSRFFIEKAFSAKAKRAGDQIVTDIKLQFVEKLKKTAWMDTQVIELAIEKVHNIVQKIGYPTKSPDITDPVALEKYYESVNITGSRFFHNALSVRSFETVEGWRSLSKPVDRDEWGMTASTVNAYYNPPGNEIVFPAGIMQKPVFDVKVPTYLNYGAFGAVAGHELSHAFDSTGRHYDQTGNFTDWWTNKTVAAFEERAQCFVDQYAKYTVDDGNGRKLHVNGRLTLGENIADAGGLSAAFAAWKAHASLNPDQDLPGLEHFTQAQLFFVSYGNWWCGASTTAAAVSRVFTDPHSPKWARILGTMANSREFRDSFSCPVQEPTCELW